MTNIALDGRFWRVYSGGMNEEVDPQKMYTVTETAKILDFNVSYIRRLCEAGHFPGAAKKSPIGHSRWIIPGEAIVAFTNQAQQKS